MKKDKSDFSEQFLALPASQLAIKLEKERAASKPKKKWLFFLNLTKKQVLAVSAFIVAVGPLYQLNVSAYKLWSERRYVSETLARADSLIAANALDDARSELEKVRVLDSSNTRLLDLSALLELDAALRLNQTKSSLRVIEIRYAESLKRNPLAVYLLGTAYINLDLEKASTYLNLAEQLNDKRDLMLSVRLCAARIWVYGRRYDTDEKAEWVDKSKLLYAEGIAIITNNPALDFSSARVALDNNLGMLSSDDELETRIRRTRNAFEVALRGGNTLSAGKAAQNLAANLKDMGSLDEAKGMILLAMQFSRTAKDTRRIYNSYYTLGQIQFLQGQLTNSQESFVVSMQSAISNMDYRIATLAFADLGKVYLMFNNTSESRSSFQQARALAKIRGDKFGVAEADYLLELAKLVENKTKKQELSNEGLDREIGILKTNQLTNLILSASYIRDGLVNQARPPELISGTYHPGFTTNLLSILLKQN
jgi:hypothetical protein